MISENNRRWPLAVAAAMAAILMEAQGVLPVGGGSIATEPPNYNLTDAAKMLTRKIYVDEWAEENIGGLKVPGRPIPTNDWWTSIIDLKYSGALWSYPAMLNTGAAGVEVCFPSYWADYGKEMKSRSSVTVGGDGFSAQSTIASDWHDWDVSFRLPGVNDSSIGVTSLHGSPFTWFSFEDVAPQVTFASRGVDTAVATPYPPDLLPEILASAPGMLGVGYGDEIYGFYFPEKSSCELDGKILNFSANADWIVVALLKDISQLGGWERYAVSRPLSTTLSWSYDESDARLTTRWEVESENLRTPGGATAVFQGFLPHVYKYALPGASLEMTGESFATPRGEMRMAASENGVFSYSYRFQGMLPAYAAPHADDSTDYGYSQEIMDELMERYATGGTFGGDTYWGGKGLTQMALNMSFARQTGNMELYETSRRRLREVFDDWFTYTPGEENRYMTYFRRWGGMLGFAVSYGSDTFNDHHFHYGYFTYAAALLCMEDPEFKEKYRDILTMLAKDYANWDRADRRFPYLRTLDPWSGHSWAGGMGDGGNDNGNGQESTSESMQGWGGLYLLGVALGDKEMRDAGIFGWTTEARATREYWYDVDAPRPANEGGRQAWPGKGDRNGNYDYSLYPYAYNSNITGKGIGWWTWFGGDPVFMHGIQWMPISPALDYLSWDTDFVGWAFDDMMSGANSTYSHEWFEDTLNTADGSRIDALAKNDWGNVALAYLQRCRPEEAARIFNEAHERGLHIASSISTSHISYFTLHNTLTYGVPSKDYHASIPSAVIYEKDGLLTPMVYNPTEEDLEVQFRNASGGVVARVTAAPGLLTAFDRGEAKGVEINPGVGDKIILAPGSTLELAPRLLDQYGAGVKGASFNYVLSEGAPATISGNLFSLNSGASLGSQFTLTITSGGCEARLLVIVNNPPVPQHSRIEGITLPEDDSLPIVESGIELPLTFIFTDQYGEEHEPSDTEWTYTTTAGESGTLAIPFRGERPGVYTVTARSLSTGAEAEVRFFVTPALPVVSRGVEAVSSGEENAGTQTSGAVDGIADASHRWGSPHKDGQWIYLDLGEETLVSRVGIIWDPAYGAEYEIQIAPEGCRMEKYTGQYASGQKTVSVPAEEEWTTAALQTLSSRSEQEVVTPVNAVGRYIRMKGIRRGTGYGFSIWEMNVYGIPASMGGETLLGVDFSLPQDMTEGETITLVPVVYRRDGKIAQGVSPTWSADKDALFEGNDFTPLSSGIYNISATLPGGEVSGRSLFVYEKVKPASFNLTATDLGMVEGESVYVDFSATDQFGCVFPLQEEDIRVSVLNADGLETSDGRYDMGSRRFYSEIPGQYTLRFGAMGIEAEARVDVKSIRESNLALGKSGRASSAEGGNVASNAFDGRMDTRWGSLWTPDEWLMVDLESGYMVDRMKIFWEGAYAIRYNIEVSLDGKDWTTVFTRQDCQGGEDEILLSEPVPARHLRINCEERKLEAYGYSIHEWEVYGVSRYGNSTESELLTDRGAGALPAEWYTLEGIRVSGSNLTPGLYLRRRGATTEKVLVR